MNAEAIKPAPIIAVTNVPTTAVTLCTAFDWDDDSLEFEPRVVVVRGCGQATKVRIHRGDWT